MSAGDQVRAILAGVVRAYQADPAYRQRADVHNELDRIGRRLNQPLRIALAGTLKAGKSTLVNALVGEDIAPTDATEATRIVTWFRYGPTPRVTANERGGRRRNVPIVREVGLTFDLADLDAAEVVDLDVEWPAGALVDATIIDTPGTSSLSPDVSERSLRLLVPDDGVPRVDAVVFLPDEVATRFTTEMDKTGICQAVVPVSGLLALTARTLRHDEFAALRKLADVDPAELAKAMLSADRFVRDDSPLPLDAATRRALLDRFGMFGIRISVVVLQAGVTDSVALADELLERSGLVALREVIDQQFAQRSDALKAHTALLSLRRMVTANPLSASAQIVADIDPLLADTHAFEELRLLSQLRSRATTLTDDEMVSLRRIIGGAGTDAASRLGLGPDSADDGPRAAFAATQRWRRRADHPLNDPFTTRACRAAVRSAEAIVAMYSSRR